MGGARRLDQLPRNADPIGRLANASFQQIPNAELPADLSDIDGAALVSKGRITRDHKERSKTRQGRRYLLDDAVGEIFLLGIATEVLEWQHDDRRSFRYRRGFGRRPPLDSNAAVVLHR